MKAHLLYRNKDYDWKWALQAEAVREAARTGRRYQPKDFDPQFGLPWNEKALTADLALTTLFTAMPRNDDCVFEVARSTILAGVNGDYKREEDASMESGKFDEELRRMSDIVGHIRRHSMILFNESFAATNEREGSEIGRQIINALLDKDVKVVCVTHLYELAHGFFERSSGDALFLRAGRQAGGTRTFKLVEGEPLPTSFGEDLYKSIFADKTATAEPTRSPLVHARVAGEEGRR
jgi:hypothetical protein